MSKQVLRKDPTGYPDWTLPVSITAQLIETLKVDISAQTLSQLNVNIAAVSETVTFNVEVQNAYLYVRTETGQNLTVDIAAQTVSTLKIDIAAQTLSALNVNITGSDVTLNVNIASSSVAINIKTETGANIVIDKLTATAYTEERRIISNNGDTPQWTEATGNYRHGKFFPRGCKGFIETIDVYCRDTGTAGGTITVYISPHPSMGPVRSAMITVEPGGAAAWRSAVFNCMWNYDSLFISLVSSSPDIQDAFDDGTPHDSYLSDDAGATWSTQPVRLWYRVNMAAQTVGDLPVSGTLNTVEIPSTTSKTEQGITTVPANSEVTLIEINGCGKMISCFFHSQNADIQYRVYCDGQLAEGITGGNLFAYGFTTSTPGLSLLQYSTTNLLTRLFDTRPFEFKRQLKIAAKNLSPVDGLAWGWVTVSLIQ